MTDALAPDLAAKLQEIIDRQAIRDCLNRYARGLDRHDDELLATAFHDDAIDNHGNFLSTNRDAFVEWANYRVHSALTAHMHHLTTHNCELDGDTAHTETYVIFVHKYKDGKTVHIAGGRYIDRLEKRDGEWRIAVRKVMEDFRVISDGSVFGDWSGYPHGTWDRTDLSYERPLDVSPEVIAQYEAAGRKH